MTCKQPSDCLRTLIRRRPMFAKDEVLKTPLSRCLNVYHLIFYSIASMAGAGIYVLTGSLIRDVTGASACISYIIAGLASAFTAMCYAEFATLIPKAGSVYVYTYLMLGELPAFIIGWTTVSDVIVSIASISKAFSGTINQLAHDAVRNWTIEHVGRITPYQSSFFSETPDFIASALIIVMIVVTATGANASMTLNCIITAAQVLCLIIISIGCYVYGSSESWSAKNGGFAPDGFHGVINGATIAVFAYSGFDTIANASEETIAPKKTIPRAMLASLIIITILYFMASFGMAYLVPKDLIDYSAPFVSGFQLKHVQWLVIVAAVGTLLATGAAKISTMYVVPRVFYAIASDGLIFRFFAKVEKHTQVPLISLFFGGTLACLLAFLVNIQTLAEFTSLGFLFSYFMIGVDIMILRYAYDMPENSAGSVSDGDDEKPDGKTAKKESKERLVPIRERFEGLVEKYPIVRSRKVFAILLSIFIGLCFVMAVVIDFILRVDSIFLIAVTILCFLILFASGMTMIIYQPTLNDDVYQSPAMPLVPLMTVFFNSLLIMRLPVITWLRFLIWTAVGLLIYIFYGRSHSVMADPEYKPLEGADEEKESAKSYGT